MNVLSFVVSKCENEFFDIKGNVDGVTSLPLLWLTVDLPQPGVLLQG